MPRNEMKVMTASGVAAALGAFGGGGASLAAGPDAPGSAATYAEVADVVWRYYAAVREPQGGDVLEGLLDPIWTARGQESRHGSVVAEDKETFITRIVERGAEPTFGADRRLTSVQVYFDDFAVVRADDWERVETDIFTLFERGGYWRIAGVSSARAEFGRREAAYPEHTSHSDVTATLHAYYRGVDDGDAAPLDRVFDANWRMKNHRRRDRAVVSEDKATFMRRIDGRPLRGYINDRQIADVQVIYDQLAYVRIDKPASRGVTVFLFYNDGDQWKIVDKAWSNGIGDD